MIASAIDQTVFTPLNPCTATHHSQRWQGLLYPEELLWSSTDSREHIGTLKRLFQKGILHLGGLLDTSLNGGGDASRFGGDLESERRGGLRSLMGASRLSPTSRRGERPPGDTSCLGGVSRRGGGDRCAEERGGLRRGGGDLSRRGL